ncbi:MAG: hypothetical protein JWR83_1250 [Aeromicrobium sp.]|nr:hypothetical protein [Aeromicrobium sp.]
MLRSSRVLAALFVAVSLSATGLVTASAQASTATTVSGLVTTTGDVPLRGVQVYAIKGSAEVSFHATDETGAFGTPSFGHLTAGTWTFIFYDTTDKYASAGVAHVLVGGAATVLPTEKLKLGGRVTGTVTAPSGAPLVNVSVLGIDPAAFEESDALAGFGVGFAFDDTDTDGTFDLRSLNVAAGQNVYLAFDEEGTIRKKGAYSINAEGDQVVVNVPNVKVPVGASIQGIKSSSKGKATVKVTVSASKYGIANPGGKFDLYDGTKKIRSAVSLVGGKSTVSLSHLKKGTHSFKFKYLGFTDTNAKTSKTVKVAVK